MARCFEGQKEAIGGQQKPKEAKGGKRPPGAAPQDVKQPAPGVERAWGGVGRVYTTRCDPNFLGIVLLTSVLPKRSLEVIPVEDRVQVVLVEIRGLVAEDGGHAVFHEFAVCAS